MDFQRDPRTVLTLDAGGTSRAIALGAYAFALGTLGRALVRP